MTDVLKSIERGTNWSWSPQNMNVSYKINKFLMRTSFTTNRFIRKTILLVVIEVEIQYKNQYQRLWFYKENTSVHHVGISMRIIGIKIFLKDKIVTNKKFS